MREYCYIHKSWYEKAKGRKATPYIVRAFVTANLKRQMTRKEGLLFVDMMIRKYNLQRRRTRP